MEEFIEYVAKQLVNNPEKVRVDRQETQDDRERYLLFVTPPDRGKIIGRQGRTIKAFRVIVGAIAARRGKRVSFDIVDDVPPPGKSGEQSEKNYDDHLEGE